MIPQINALNVNNLKPVIYPTRTYRILFQDNRIQGMTDGLQAIQQLVHHILNTERYKYLIYDDDYGVELEQFLSRGFEYLKSNIRRVIRDAILNDNRILDVQFNNIEQTAVDACLIDFTVVTGVGTFSEVMEIERL